MRSIDIAAEEQVLRFYRKHFLVVFAKLIWASAALAIGIFLVSLNIRYVSFAGVLLIVAGLGKFLYEFIVWYYDIYVVTNQRIMDINQRGIFSREVFEAPLSNVLNISQSTHGPMETLFNFGTVAIQTASSELKFEGVNDPAEVQNIIRAAMDDFGNKG